MQPYVKDQHWEYFHCYECQPNTGYLSPNVRPLANSYPPKQPFKSSFSIETLLGGGTERGWRPANVVPPTQPEKTTSVSAKLREFEERRRNEKEKQSFYAATSQASGATKNEAQHVQADSKKAYSSPYGKSFLCSHSKNKRPRTMFTLCQLERMEREFLRRQYITGNQRQKLAEELQLSETQVRVWFQNRRIKWRKQMIKSQFNNF